MKKLLLLPLVAIGLALVPAKQADAQVSIGVGGVGIGFGYPGSSDAVNRSITEITGTVSFLAVRTENRGSAQVGVQTSWLRREPWSVGNGPGSANAFLFFVQMRYNLP